MTGRIIFKGNPVKNRKGETVLVDANVTGSDRGTPTHPNSPLMDLWRDSLFGSLDFLVQIGGRYEGYTVVFQEDNAGPHEETQYTTWLREQFDARGWHIKLQAPQVEQ